MKTEQDFIYDPNLVLYLPLYELDGASFMSKDAFGHLCTVTGALWTPRGHSFDGTDDVINCGSATSLDALTGNMTVIAWVNPTSLGENNLGRIVDKGLIVLLMGATAKATFQIQVSSAFKTASSANNSVPLGSWTHVVGVFNGSNVLIYTNLRPVTGTATAGPVDDHSATSLLIGDGPASNRCFNGLIGEVCIYNRALTVLEIQHNYLATKWRYQ